MDNRAGRTSRLFVALVALAGVGGILAAGALVLTADKAPRGFDLQRLPAETRDAYHAAESHGDLFAHLPCYCGCAVLPEPHRSLLDCFLKPGGGYESHAGGCVTCVDIALEAVRANAEGLDHVQIRALVDGKFSERGPPTDTAYP